MTQTAADPSDEARLALAKEAADVRERSKAVSDRLRERADSWGKGLTALGTTVVGYLGITKATDVFPIPAGWGWLTAAAFGCLILMIALAVSLGWRLSRATRPVVMKNDPTAIPDVSAAERKQASDLYEQYASINGAASLDAYDKIGQEIAGAYESATAAGEQPSQPFSRAVQIRAEVQCAQQRAATLIVRRRTGKATGGFLTMATIVLFLVAGVGFGIATDKIADIRTSETDILTTIKQCGEASAAKATYPSITAEVPASCRSMAP